MRHAKRSFKVGRTTAHRRCMMANMLKSLIEHNQIETSVVKAKELRRYADKMITLAKKNTLASRRMAKGRLMVVDNALTPKEAKAAKSGDLSAYNTDRKVLQKLFGELGQRYVGRNGGYTRIIRLGTQKGDNAQKCVIEFV
ncbi:MAG: 50S ribosomal protein L17 [Chlamydiae bacterium]|nr:50S ribosomal protein L17 [Chlamydiota bacterium]